MKKKIGTNGIRIRKFKLTLAVLICIFSLISVSAAASDKGPWVASIEKNGDTVLFADHDSSQDEGGWIKLSGGQEIQLPQPLSFSYCGPDCLEWAGATIKLYPESESATKPDTEKYTGVTFTYPYSTHPFYTKNQKVTMDYNGPSDFKNKNVDIYLFKELGPSTIAKAIDNGNISLKEALEAGSISCTKTCATLDKNGDLTKPLTFGSLEPMSYGVLITLADEDDKVLSATWFDVVNYGMKAKALNTIKEGKNLEVDMSLINPPANGEIIYGAMLVKKEAYKAEIKVNTNGTRDGTDVFINEINLADDLCLNSTNLSKDDLTKSLQTIIGAGNGTISVGEENQDTLSLTTFDLPAGDYYLFTGAYEEGKGIVGVDQKELKIISTGTSPK